MTDDRTPIPKRVEGEAMDRLLERLRVMFEAEPDQHIRITVETAYALALDAYGNQKRRAASTRRQQDGVPSHRKGRGETV